MLRVLLLYLNLTKPQRERFDKHNLRRGFVGEVANSHGATARAIQFARHHSKIDSTRTISAEGSSARIKIRTAPAARAIRRAQSPQRVRGPRRKVARCHSQSDPIRLISGSAEGSRATLKIRTGYSESDPTRTISAEGSRATLKTCTAPQRERSNARQTYPLLRKKMAFIKGCELRLRKCCVSQAASVRLRQSVCVS